jgi:hypothetical protein
MASNCLVCGRKLRQNGGLVKYCSRGKSGCRRRRTELARETLAQAAGRVLLGRSVRPLIVDPTAEQIAAVARSRVAGRRR